MNGRFFTKAKTAIFLTMKKHMFKHITGVILLMLMASAFAPAQQPKTVTDFYYLLPSLYFNSDPESSVINKKYRQLLIETEDIKNGYLRLYEKPNTEGNSFWSEIALFKKANGKYIVGISGVTCGNGCLSQETFFSYENGEWEDITETVLPDIPADQIKAAYERHQIKEDDQGLIYNLPRFGTTITVRLGYNDHNGKVNYNPNFKSIVLFELKWNGASFVLVEK